MSEQKEKLSHRFWDSNLVNTEDQAGNKFVYFDGDKTQYDEILSIEAKIEELEGFYKENYINLQGNVVYMMQERLKKLESQLSELEKKHGLG